jgi:glycosyltransferase involved in cell wall biosynthesis
VAPYEDPFVMATFGRNIPLPEGCPSEARDLDIWYPDKFIDVPERFSNGNASVRKAAWEKIPFNESVTGSEDILWADEIIKRGFQIIYVPNAPVYHSHSSSLTYAFRRRFRETKALATNGHQHGISLIDVLTWTVRQTVADFRYVRQKGYGVFWYFHVLPYRFSQVLGMYASTERREKMRETVLRQLRVLKTSVIGYYHKSLRVIHNEGWGTFFYKAKRKLLTKLHIMQVTLEHTEIVLPAIKKIPSPRKFKVIFVVDPVGPLTNHFRAYNMKEYLALLDLESEIMSETSLNYQVITTADIVVLCRVFMNPHIEKLVETCRTLRIPVLFDADDFVIDPVIVEQISSLDGITEYEKSLHREGLRKHRQSFLSADFFTAPTHYLADIGKAFGKPSLVIRNGLSVAQMETSRAILDIKGFSSSHHAGVKVGYFSGSKSHEKDFSVVVPALVRIMEEFPHVSLYIGGYLELDSTLEKFHDRVKRLPFVDISRLPYNLSKVDINIAPLEVNNPFCEAKSELKYFDAGLLKIPTVASPTDAYRCAIQHGVNGYLAGSSEEWYDFLKALVEDAGLRAMMGERAYEHVLNSYAPNAMAVAVRNVYEEVITQYRKEREISEDALKISFVVPGPERGSGGLNKVFTAARYLSEFGHSVFLYFLNDGKVRSHEQLKEFVFTHYFDPKSEIILGTDAISSCDILCATSWKTAYAVHEKRTQAAQLFYFVQDIESLFFPMGDDYLKAENTYRLGFSHVTYGPWCKKILRERYKAKADSIPFSLDKTIYYPRAVEKEKTKRVLFFSRPEMTRRCFWLGLEALDIFHRRNPEVIITLFGSEEITHHHIPFPHENLGVLSKEELAHLYSGADVGVAFSTTNPSLVPFEMMACGCPVVDLDYGDNYVNYGSSENIKLVRPSPQAIAGGIEELIKDDRLRYQFAEKGYQYVIEFPDDHEVFKIMEEIFLAALNPSVLPHQECPLMKESSQRCR